MSESYLHLYKLIINHYKIYIYTYSMFKHTHKLSNMSRYQT